MSMMVRNCIYSKSLQLKLLVLPSSRFYGTYWGVCSSSSRNFQIQYDLISSSRSIIMPQQQQQQFTKRLSTSVPLLSGGEMVDITFITNDGKKLNTKGKIGDNLLDVVVNNQIDLDGFGACEGTLACSTCHLVFKKTDFDKITDKVSDEELDMLDLAYGLQDTSRLGCQVTLTKDLNGVEVEVPAGVNDQRSS